MEHALYSDWSISLSDINEYTSSVETLMYVYTGCFHSIGRIDLIRMWNTNRNYQFENQTIRRHMQIHSCFIVTKILDLSIIKLVFNANGILFFWPKTL